MTVQEMQNELNTTIQCLEAEGVSFEQRERCIEMLQNVINALNNI